MVTSRILSRLILVAAVLVAMVLALNRAYVSAGGLVVALLGYAYIVA